jgi:hypothetical protein
VKVKYVGTAFGSISKHVVEAYMLAFQKFPEFPMGQFDGFDSATGYQMVPVRDRREMGVITENEELVLSTRHPSRARFANLRTSSGPIRSTEMAPARVVLPPRSRVAFSIMGISPGHVDVVLEGPDGAIKLLLLVSVKEVRKQVYNLAFLRDIRRTTTRSHADAQSKMKSVERTFLQQANVELRAALPPTDVVVPKDLKNPVRIDRPDMLRAIIDATPAPLFGNSAIIIYSVWDASDHRPSVGITTGNLCFIDDAQLNAFEAALTFGHEVGHALGLSHNGKNVLMAGDGVARSSRLVQFEIDTINQSGLE